MTARWCSNYAEIDNLNYYYDAMKHRMSDVLRTFGPHILHNKVSQQNDKSSLLL